MQHKWSIAIYKGPMPFALKPLGRDVPAIAPETVSDIDCRTVADPFLLLRADGWYMFFEALNGAVNRGEIALATSANGTEWKYSGIVLRESFHLSYPHVFEHQGTVYMIPETRQAASIRLYAATAFPDQWRLVSVLASGQYADSTIFFHEGKWWIFAQRGLDEMRLFHSESLESGWTEHVGNPFWAANRTYCRPGGRVICFEDKLYRFAQDGVDTYGNNLRALQIRRLSETAFEETEIPSGPVLRPSMRGWNAMGMHHLDAVNIGPREWLGAVDGCTLAF